MAREQRSGDGLVALYARLAYLSRIVAVYGRPASGPLSFWYEQPELNQHAWPDGREYFMTFRGKSAYRGPFDSAGIPLLNYQGSIGLQYNPIAIAQYGLARLNQWHETHSPTDRDAWLAVARWLASNLTKNEHGVPVWMHRFDWPYRETLRAPWYSGLAQGNGLSMLVRAARETEEPAFAEAAHRTWESFTRPIAEGGVLCVDESGDSWIEEYLVDPASHILNGFIWATWGVYDYAHWSGEVEAARLWEECCRTLERRLGEFDVGWWTLYEARHNQRRMLASIYYHRLHITQLRVQHRLTGSAAFLNAAERFERYMRNPLLRTRAVAEKVWFKVRHY